jgi:hypothetical protein
LLCPILFEVQSLAAIHLSGNGIKRNFDDPENDLMLEVLDYFGLDDIYWRASKRRVNRPPRDPNRLKKTIH